MAKAVRSGGRGEARGATGEDVRLDIWLDVACLFKTRSEAKRGCEGGKVDLNGEHAKPHRPVRPGDEIRISRPLGRKQTVRVVGVADAHLPKAEARALYEDLTPPPTAEEVEMRRMDRLYRAAAAAAGTDRRKRREQRSRKERGATF
jgi:ribosome-associated heat shock protein Hsp15